MFELDKPCKLCHDAFHYEQGTIGKNYYKKRIMMVLNRSDSRAIGNHENSTKSWQKAFLKTNTGRTIEHILDMAQLDFDDILITNFYKCIRPKDKEPTKTQYKNCRSIFEKQLKAEEPEKIVLFGSPVYKAYSDLNLEFVKAAGNIQNIHGIETFVSYHPSGIRFLEPKPKEENFKKMVEYLKK